MRGLQRSITHSFTAIAVLVIAVALSAGYFTYYIDAKKTGKFSTEITSFEECAKRYPVMESYPEQCNTPDGKHFINGSINTEPPSEDLESLNNKTYSYDGEYFEGIFYKFKYPQNHIVSTGAYGCNPIIIKPTDKSINGQICVVEDTFHNNNLKLLPDLGYGEKLISKEDFKIKNHEAAMIETIRENEPSSVTITGVVKDVPLFLRGMKPKIETGILVFSYNVNLKNKEFAKKALKEILDTLEIQSR